MVAQRQRVIVINAMVNEDHRLIIDLPPDMPTGEVTVTVTPTQSAVPTETPIPVNERREHFRTILLAAGKLGTAHMPPPSTIRPSEEEIRRAGILPPGARPSEDIIRELRDDD